MKKLSIAILLCSIVYLPALACDVCGGGASSSNPFLFPQSAKNFLSLSYTFRRFTNPSLTGFTPRQTYHALQLSGQYSLHKKLQVQAVLPYHQNRLVQEKGTTRVSGLGDISLLANYVLLNKTSKGIRHSFILGGGVKLPTGKHTDALAKETAEQNFQPGTGSIDYLANAFYRIGFRQWAIHAMTAYKYNTQNTANYRYGDVLTTGLMAVYRLDRGRYSIAPYVQASYEHLMQDAADHKLQEHSGGNVLYTGLGIDYNTRDWALGANYQLAAAQHLANGDIRVKPKFNIRFSFILN